MHSMLVSKNERLKNFPIDVRISATFKEAVGHSNAIAYALILSDKIINLQSNGNKNDCLLRFLFIKMVTYCVKCKSKTEIKKS